MEQRIFIVGATGKIGNALISKIYDKGDNDSKIHQNPTSVVGVASSSTFLYDSKGLGEEQVRNFAARKITGKPMIPLEKLPDAINGDGPIIFVDVTAEADKALALHRKVIEKTQHGIVTANKLPLVICDTKSFWSLTEKPNRYGYRCSVMAGADVVDNLRDYRDLLEPPTAIEGCFSGTLGFVASELEKGRIFSEIIEEAKNKGYTEPDPMIDLSGVDVARKLLILARSAGVNVELKDITLESFIPKGKAPHDIDDYLSKAMKAAKQDGNTLRYVASYRRPSNANSKKAMLSVKLESVSQSSSLGQLSGTDNMIIITRKNGVTVVKAPGAGTDVTASNIRRDLLYHLSNRIVTENNGEE